MIFLTQNNRHTLAWLTVNQVVKGEFVRDRQDAEPGVEVMSEEINKTKRRISFERKLNPR